MRRRWSRCVFRFALVAGLSAFAFACSSSSGGAADTALADSGGAGGQGGGVGTGGTVATGGAGVGGIVGNGGATGPGGRTGTPSSGGVTSAGGGGAIGSGGVVVTGGAIGVGGSKDASVVGDGSPPLDGSVRVDGGRAGGAGGGVGTGGRIGTGGRTGSGGATSTGGAPATGGIAGGGGTTGTAGAPGTCIGQALLSSLGKDTVLIGGSMDDATAAKAPFDGRYLYLAGGLFDGSAPCASCTTGCTAGGSTCASAACAWWGCWQDVQAAPGQYVISFVNVNEKASPKQIPMFTYYEELQASGLGEGTAQVAALNDAAVLTRYLADWRFVLQKIGTHPALLHIEPDFWGYVEQINSDPHAVPAKVTTANSTDCAGYDNSAAGVAKCMIHMVRVYAPSAKVGLHASAWGTNYDVFGNTNAKLDVVAEAKKMATFLTALGAGDGDFIVSDPSDRDAGYYQVTQNRNTWWDDTNATLPNFHQAFTWTKALAEAMNLPIIFWQIPVGNMSLDNTNLHYKDNRLDYFYAHMDEVVAAHIVGLYFGAGATGPTTPETDGGNFVAKTTAYRSVGGAKICP